MTVLQTVALPLGDGAILVRYDFTDFEFGCQPRLGIENDNFAEVSSSYIGFFHTGLDDGKRDSKIRFLLESVLRDRIIMSTFMAKKQTVQPEWYVIDATDAVVGRLAVTIANLLRGKHRPDYTPHCDTGTYVIVVNAEKVKFTGKKWEQKSYQTYSHYAGGQKIILAQEMLAKKPEEILRLAVKRMIPRNRLGRYQMGKLKIYAGPQHPHQGQQPKAFQLSPEA